MIDNFCDIFYIENSLNIKDINDTQMTPSKQDKAKLIIKIENEMREAAKNLDFEKAMELRDILFELKSE